MRCRHCGRPNPDQASFCVHCGRELAPAAHYPPYTPPTYPPVQLPPPPGASVGRRGGQNVAAPPNPQNSSASRKGRKRGVQPVVEVQEVAAPIEVEAPAPFPPKTLEQLKLLTQGALDYTKVSEGIANGKRKTVRISFRTCAPWQQVATLLKALNAEQSTMLETIIVQGLMGNDVDSYGYNNGQLQFDRNVRLGSQMLNRYVIETGTGFESSSIRIVLAE